MRQWITHFQLKLPWKQLTLIFRAISEIRGKSKRPDEARIFNFVKGFLDDSGESDGSFWERMKTIEDQGVIINTPTKCGSSFFLSKSLHEPYDSNSDTINTTPTVSLPSNAPVWPNNEDVSSLSEGIDSLEQFFDTQLQILCKCLRLNPVVREQALTASDILSHFKIQFSY